MSEHNQRIKSVHIGSLLTENNKNSELISRYTHKQPQFQVNNDIYKPDAKADKLKKWKQIAKQVNKQIQLSRYGSQGVISKKDQNYVKPLQKIGEFSYCFKHLNASASFKISQSNSKKNMKMVNNSGQISMISVKRETRPNSCTKQKQEPGIKKTGVLEQYRKLGDKNKRNQTSIKRLHRHDKKEKIIDENNFVNLQKKFKLVICDKKDSDDQMGQKHKQESYNTFEIQDKEIKEPEMGQSQFLQFNADRVIDHCNIKEQTGTCVNSDDANSKKRGQVEGSHNDKFVKNNANLYNSQQDRMVLKIGSNMQYQQKLIKYHIQNIRRINSISPTPMPIIFCIKNQAQVFNACIMSSKDQEMPICISIFAQNFDAKCQQSAKKKELYIENMLRSMNGSYDLQIMSRMPILYTPGSSQKYKRPTVFNAIEYKAKLQLFQEPLQPNIKKKLQELIYAVLIKQIEKGYYKQKSLVKPGLKTIKNLQVFNDKSSLRALSLSSNISASKIKFKFNEFLQQILENYKQGSAITNLDYFLKNPQNQMQPEYCQIRQYLNYKKQNIMSYRICYHGGYSKNLYKNWHRYIKNSRTELPRKLQKLSVKIQQVNKWLYQFNTLNFVQVNLLDILIQPISLCLMKNIQLRKIEQIFGIFYHICLKGVLTILQFNRNLHVKQKQYSQIKEERYYSKLVKSYTKYQYLQGQLQNQVPQETVQNDEEQKNIKINTRKLSSRRKKKNLFSINLQNDQQLLEWYSNKLKQLHTLKRVQKIQQLSLIQSAIVVNKIGNSGNLGHTVDKNMDTQNVNINSNIMIINRMNTLNLTNNSFLQNSQHNHGNSNNGYVSSVISDTQRKKINKSIQILMDIFYQKMISQSLQTLVTLFTKNTKTNTNSCGKAYLRLNLVVDRQSLRIQQTEQDVMQIFNTIINAIVKTSFNVTSSGMTIISEQNNCSQQRKSHKSIKRNNNLYSSTQCLYQQFGNIHLPQKSNQTARITPSWQLKIEYRNMQNQERNIKKLFHKLKQWYHQAQMLIQNFSSFMPFIKLTAKEKIFVQQLQMTKIQQKDKDKQKDNKSNNNKHKQKGKNNRQNIRNEWQYAKQLFLINRQKVIFYRQKLQKIPQKFVVGIFEVNCSQPHRVLQERISQIQYLFQQKYLSKIFQKIHEIEQQLGKIINFLHTLNIKVNSAQQISNNFEKSKDQLIQIRNLMKQLAKHIYFYVDKQIKPYSNPYQSNPHATCRTNLGANGTANQNQNKSKSKANTVVIIRYIQLVHKIKQLQKQIQEYKSRVKQEIYYLQLKRQQQCNIFKCKLSQYEKKLQEICKQYFEVNKLDRTLRQLKKLKDQYQQFQEEFKQINDPNYKYEKQKQKALELDQCINTIYSYWNCMNIFTNKNKQFSRYKLTDISQQQYTQYEKVIQQSARVIQQFQLLNITTEEYKQEKFEQQVRKSKTNYDNSEKSQSFNKFHQSEDQQQINRILIYVNQLNKKDLVKFKEDIEKNKQYIQYIKIITDVSIDVSYYTIFKCQQLVGITFREIFQLANPQTSITNLKVLETQARAQQKIHHSYINVNTRFNNLKLTIIDFHGCDTLDPYLTKQLIHTLRQSIFQLQILLLSPYSQKYMKEIVSLGNSIEVCLGILMNWLQLQGKFVKLEKFYRNNQDVFFKQKFKLIQQSHRKIIKSFDMDNSVLLLPKNSFLVSSLSSFSEMLDKLKQEIFCKFNQLQSVINRLQLLNHEQLLEMTSQIKHIPKYLRKIIVCISNFGLNDQCIERIGGITDYQAKKVKNSNNINTISSDNKNVANNGGIPVNKSNKREQKDSSIVGNYIILKEPINIGSRLINVQIWLQKLIADIKHTMKLSFLAPSGNINMAANVSLNRKQHNLQILMLKQQIQFTSEIQNILGIPDQQADPSANLTVCTRLQSHAKSIELKIQEKTKQELQKYNAQMLILLLILQRDTISNLIQSSSGSTQVLSSHSFQWLKVCRFYNSTQIEGKKLPKAAVKMQIVNEQYQYYFMFIQNCQFIIHDCLFIGNCLIGKQGFGKKSIIKNYAYITGNQLFQFETNRISPNYIQNIVNYYKLAITTGSWLVIPQINKFTFQQLRVVAQCLSSLKHAISLKLQKMEMFAYNSFPINSNCRIFFTLQNFNNIPVRLSHNFRTIWIGKPHIQFINSIYNQIISITESLLTSTRLRSQNQQNERKESLIHTYKTLDFIYWNYNAKNIPLSLFSNLFKKQVQKYIAQYTPNDFINYLANIKFILPEDLLMQNRKQQFFNDNVDLILQNCKYSIFYVSSSQMNNFIASNFCQENSICLKLKQNQINLTKFKKVANYIRQIIRMKKAKLNYVIFQNNLKHYKVIQNQLMDQLQAELQFQNVKYIYVQDLVNLQCQQKYRISANYPTVIFKAQPKSPSSISKEKQVNCTNINIIASKTSNQSNSSKSSLNKTKKINFKTTYFNHEQIIQLEAVHQKFVRILIKKHLRNTITGRQIQQITKYLNTMYTRMIQAQFSKQVSFVYSLAWIFGNYISQNSIIKQLNEYEHKFSFAKLIMSCVNLRQMYPTRYGFITLTQNMEQTHKLIMNQGQIQFKSIILSNLKFIRKLLSSQAVIFKSKYQIQEFINVIFRDAFHYHPTDLPTPIVTKDKIQHMLKIKVKEIQMQMQKQQNQGNKHNYQPHFIIHSFEKYSKQIIQFVLEFVKKGSAFYQCKGDMQMFSFKDNKCKFTFTVSNQCKIEADILTIELMQDQIIAIESDYMQNILKLQKNYQKFDKNILKGISSSYRQSLAKYYWFQQPIRIALRKYLKNSYNKEKHQRKSLGYLSQNNSSKILRTNLHSHQRSNSITKLLQSQYKQDGFFMLLLRYQFIAIPLQKTKIINQICYSSVPISFVKSQQHEYQIKMNNLTETNNFLQRNLNRNQIWMKKNICKDMVVLNQSFNPTPYTYDMLYRTYLAISESHTVLIGGLFTQRFYCLQMTAKILNLQFVPLTNQIFNQPEELMKNKLRSSFQQKGYHQDKQQSQTKRKILLIKQTDLTQQLLTKLQSYICKQNSHINTKYVVVIKLNCSLSYTQKIYNKYPFIKRYFLHVFFPPIKKQQTSQNINLVKTLRYLQNGQNKYELSVLNDWEIPPELQVQKSISHYFETQLKKNFGFLVKLLQIRKQFEEQEFNKYKFYRRLTEQLFYIMASYQQQIKKIPLIVHFIRQEQTEIAESKQQSQKVYNILTSQQSKLKQQQQRMRADHEQKVEKYNQMRQIVSNNQKQCEITFRKIYTKLQNMSMQDHSKFKPANPNLNVNSNSSATGFVSNSIQNDSQLINCVFHLICVLLKCQKDKLKKIPSAKLDALIKQNINRLDKNKQAFRRIAVYCKNSNYNTTNSSNVSSNKKKVQKIPLIFSTLIQWIQAVQHFIFRLGDQNQKANSLIEVLNQQIGGLKEKLAQIGSKRVVKNNEIGEVKQKIEQFKKQEKQRNDKINLLKTRQYRLQKVLKQINDNEYKIKISKDLAQRLYFIPKIIMSKSITQISFNEYEDDYYIAKQLFLISASQRNDSHYHKSENDEAKDIANLHSNIQTRFMYNRNKQLHIKDEELFKYDIPLFCNVFDDFGAVLQVYEKYIINGAVAIGVPLNTTNKSMKTSINYQINNTVSNTNANPCAITNLRTDMISNVKTIIKQTNASNESSSVGSLSIGSSINASTHPTVNGNNNPNKLGFDEVKLIYTILNSKSKIQLIEDAYSIIWDHLIQICGNSQNYKIVDLCNNDTNMQVIRRQLTQKLTSYRKILVTLSRYQKQSQVRKLISMITDVCSQTHYNTCNEFNDNCTNSTRIQNQGIKIIVLFKRFEPLYQTDRFRWISDGRMCYTYRRYLRQYAKIVEQKQLINEWEYYKSEHQFNKYHKMLFQVVEKFQPSNEESYERLVNILHKLQETRQIRNRNFQFYDQYFQQLAALSSRFNPYYILLKYLENFDRTSPIQIFQGGNIMKCYQQAMKKANAHMYECQNKNSTQLFKKFIVFMSNLINFIGQDQLIQYCMISVFLLSKPSKITSYLFTKFLKQAEKYQSQSERIQFIIQNLSHSKCSGVSLPTIQQMVKKRNLENLCENWIKYLIYFTSPNYQQYSESFLKQIKQTQYSGFVNQIMEKTHYYVYKSKLDFKNQIKNYTCSTINIATSSELKSKSFKNFWIIKVEKQHSQKFMQMLQNKVYSLKQQIKLVNFFFNESKYEGNFEILKKISERKIFLCIFNLNRQKSYIAEQIINCLSRYKDMNPICKIFFLFEDSIQLKNRQFIDFITYVPPETNSEQNIHVKVQDQIDCIVNKMKPTKKSGVNRINKNINIINALHVIIQKCTNRLCMGKQKDQIFNYLLGEFLKQSIINKQGNVLKYLIQYFKPFRVKKEQIQEYCKIKQPLMCFSPSDSLKSSIQSTTLSLEEFKQRNEQNILKWRTIYQRMQGCNHIQQKYRGILKDQIKRIIEYYIKCDADCNKHSFCSSNSNNLQQIYDSKLYLVSCNGYQKESKIIIDETQIRNVLKYGWIVVQNASILKFLLYKGLRRGIKDLKYEQNFQIINELKMICQRHQVNEVTQTKPGNVGNNSENQDILQRSRSQQTQTIRVEFNLHSIDQLFRQKKYLTKQVEFKVKAIQQKNCQILLDVEQIQLLLENYNIRLSLSGQVDTLGLLYITVK